MDLARYILKILNDKDNLFDIVSLSTEFDNDERFIESILDFLKEVEWIREDRNGRYMLTPEGEKNCYS